MLKMLSCRLVTIHRNCAHLTDKASSHMFLGHCTQSSVLGSIFTRNYGHSRKQRKPKPEKITHFEYSGDLRNLPQLDMSKPLYQYRGMEKDLEGDDILEKLSSLEFASGEELKYHKKEVVYDRIRELFGPDSELEQEIARLTLKIRRDIPWCIRFRTDKLSKIWLLKTIFRRRRLLTHLRDIDHQRFEWLLRELKIRYVIPKDRVEPKGWKHDNRVAIQTETKMKQREKLEDLKAKFEEEKKAFYSHKAEVLSQIEKDLEEFGLGRDFLDQLQLEVMEGALQETLQAQEGATSGWKS